MGLDFRRAHRGEALPMSARVMLALTTSETHPWSHDRTNVDAYLSHQRNSGWTVREAYFRNWVMWRHWIPERHRVLILPAEQGFAAPEDFRLFIGMEALRCCDPQWPNVPAVRLHHLFPELAGMPVEHLRRRYVRAERQVLRLER